MALQQKFTVISIGSCAQEILQENSSAEVIGNTSKGIFARTRSDQILFLTSDPYRGPLTINLPAGVRISVLSRGSTLCLSPAAIDLKAKQTLIITGQTEIYHPQNQKILRFDINECDKRAERIRAALHTRFDPKLELSGQKLSLLSGFFQNNTVEKIVEYLTTYLGLGTGLTPSGDDFICGMFLALSAWRKFLFPGLAADSLFGQIGKLALKRTTSLSANLISCAARGTADERVLNCRFWLHTGKGIFINIKKELLTYGSSSGVDTLQGMLTALAMSPAVH